MEALQNYLALLQWGAYASVGALLLSGLNTLLLMRLLGAKDTQRALWNPRPQPAAPRPPVWNPQTQQWETPRPIEAP